VPATASSGNSGGLLGCVKRKRPGHARPSKRDQKAAYWPFSRVVLASGSAAGGAEIGSGAGALAQAARKAANDAAATSFTKVVIGNSFQTDGKANADGLRMTRLGSSIIMARKWQRGAFAYCLGSEPIKMSCLTREILAGFASVFQQETIGFLDHSTPGHSSNSPFL
jgi:hypothetical protein